MCRANAPVFWPFSHCPKKKIVIFSLCAPIKPDKSLFHRRGNFPVKTFRPGLRAQVSSLKSGCTCVTLIDIRYIVQ